MLLTEHLDDFLDGFDDFLSDCGLDARSSDVILIATEDYVDVAVEVVSFLTLSLKSAIISVLILHVIVLVAR